MPGASGAGPNRTSETHKIDANAMNAEQIRNNTNDGLDEAVNKFESATEGVEAALARGKEQLHHLQEQAVECSRKVAQDADKYIHEKPWQAVGVAAALGVVVGLLVSRR